MAERTQISHGRKVLAGAAMAGAAGIMGHAALHPYGTQWTVMAFAGVLAASGVGMTRQGLGPQVLARGAAWLVLLPTLMMTLARVWGGAVPELDVGGLAGCTAAALLLARPLLHTKAAKAEFAPRVFRRWLLAGSIGTASVGIVAALGAFAAAFDEPLLSGALAALAASLLASAIAVVRMRAWGILLGGVTTVALLGVSAFAKDSAILFLAALAAAPTLLMHVLPILVARWTRLGSRSRVVHDEATTASSFEPVRYRVAHESHELDLDRDEEVAGERRAAMTVDA